MARAPRNFKHQAIREAKRRPGTEVIQRQGNDIGVLHSQRRVIEQEVDGYCDLIRRTLVNRIEHPKRFGQNEVRHPRSVLDEGFRCLDLRRIVANQEADEHVGINCAHALHADAS